MKKLVLKLNVDPRKFEATQQFMQEKGIDIESELNDSVARFYKKYVPSAVRKYIEITAPISLIPHEIEPNSANSGGI